MEMPNQSMQYETAMSSFYSNPDDGQLRDTSSKLYDANFGHHNPDSCVCDDCDCGRHLCKLHAIAPDMSKTSTYKKSFQKRSKIPSLAVKTSDAPKIDGPHLDINSVQRKDFSGRKGDDTSRPKPEDLLKTGGPSPFLTSYSSGFPGHKGQNQYVKPIDNNIRGNFPLMSQTTYGKTFGQSGGKAASLEKTPDSLKHSSLWFGQTSYGNNFRAPNP